MKRMSWLVLLLTIVGSAGCAANAPVQPLSIGQQVDFSLLEDQRGNAFAHQQDMKLVLYVDGMKAKNLVRDALVDVDQSCLNEGRVVYLADISGMPSLISSLIAIRACAIMPIPSGWIVPDWPPSSAGAGRCGHRTDAGAAGRQGGGFCC
ncbi:MAG: hypothetical protein R3F38_00685 [Gammaproteobacteria bacterium]